MSTVTKNYTCDILELPDYLSQQAKQGLMIKKITSARLYFTQGDPAELDYKIIPVNNNTEFDHRLLAGCCCRICCRGTCCCCVCCRCCCLCLLAASACG